MLSHLSDLNWADPDPTSSHPINIIIGTDLYNDLILDGVRKGESGQPIAQNSLFGWIISGPLRSTAIQSHVLSENDSSDGTLSRVSVHHCISFLSFEEEICRFWEIEEPPSRQTLTPLDKQCEEHFCSTHSRDADGRYIVRLSFKSGPQYRPISAGLELSRRGC